MRTLPLIASALVTYALSGCIAKPPLESQRAALEVANLEYEAALTGRFAGRVRAAGREFAFTERYSTVWGKQRGVWRLVLEHGSVAEEER